MKILIINIKYLGDLIVSTPGIRSLRKKYPDAEIVFMVRKGYETVLSNNPNINRIITFDPDLKTESGKKSLFDGLRFLRSIRKENFDVIIALHPGDRIALLSFFSGAKIRIAPRKQSFSFLCNVIVDVEEDSISYLDYYNRIISAFDVPIDSQKTEFFYKQSDNNWAQEFFISNKISNANIVIGLHPGASEPSKIWKTENFVMLINRLLSKSHLKIIVMEGPQDREICAVIKKSFPDSDKVFFTDANMFQTAALISRCNLFITHDTGTRHLAAAVGTPVLALIPDDNEKYWNFYSEEEQHYTLVGKRKISQVNSLERSFLDGIPVEIVYNKICSMLNLS